jgi:hypothetical protein
MKKFIFLLLASVAFISVEAQTRTKTTANINQGEYIDFGGTNMVPSDSLQVTDSIAYIIPITHLNLLSAFQVFRWKKVGAGTATVTVNYFQGNDPSIFFAVTKGSAQATYTKTFTLSADTDSQINFLADSANISGRYLKVQFITSNTASVKGYIANRLKTNIK